MTDTEQETLNNQMIQQEIGLRLRCLEFAMQTSYKQSIGHYETEKLLNDAEEIYQWVGETTEEARTEDGNTK